MLPVEAIVFPVEAIEAIVLPVEAVEANPELLIPIAKSNLLREQ